MFGRILNKTDELPSSSQLSMGFFYQLKQCLFDYKTSNNWNLKAELLLRQSSYFRAHLDWSVKEVSMCEEKVIDTDQGSLEYKQIA